MPTPHHRPPAAPRLAALALAASLPLPALAQVQGQAPGGSAADRTSPGGERRVSLVDVPWVLAQGGRGPVELDTSVGGPGRGDGGPLSVGGRTFARGLGTAATSLVTYDLRGEVRRFTTWVGVDDSVAASGSVVFRVVGDGVVLYDSGVLTGADPASFSGSLDVRGVHELQLIVTDAGDGYALDHADWCAPWLWMQPGGQPGGDGSALAHRRGTWDSALAWPLQAIHASLLPTGELLSHASADPLGPGSDLPGDPHDTTAADLAVPGTWTHGPVDHPLEEVFGAGHTLLADGSVLTVGAHDGRDGSGEPFGRRQASRFEAADARWIPAAELVQQRWGASALTLGNGDVLALGGAHASGNVHRPEVFDGCVWRTLAGIDTQDWLDNGDPVHDHTWPVAHLASDGRVLRAGWDEDMAFLDTTGNGSQGNVLQRETGQRTWGSAAMFDIDRSLYVGGVDHQGTFGDARRDAVVLDFSGPLPSATPTGDMLFPRADANATLLADGSVLVSGGAFRHATASEPSQLFVPEIWDPATGQWEVAAAAQHPRRYLSTALLLPDGRVWTGGGECGPGCPSGQTAEVFSPPYLFDASSPGQLASRPVVQSAPGEVTYGSSFAVALAGAQTIDRVTLLRLGSATHGLNLAQRFLELSFVQAGATLTVDAPADGNLAPPGHYLLFAIDTGGVPSEAAIVRLDLPAVGSWQTLVAPDGSEPEARHETAMVSVGGKFYLMGGRGSRPVQEYDPVTGIWTDLGNPPIQMHHYQPIVHEGLVWVVGAFVGNYPNETPVPQMYIYDPSDNSWTPGPAMPAGRNRGSSGTVVHEGKFYVVGGNTMGHNGGYVPWFDVFDPVAGTWTALPDAPNARDHFLATVVGTKLVAAGGRRTDLPNPFDNTIAQVDVYDFSTGLWSGGADDIPTERAGTMAVAVDGFTIVAGGESNAITQAHAEVEALDVLTGEWHSLPALVEDRHSGGIATHAGRVVVASGSGARGGSPELDSFEVLFTTDLLEGLSSNPVVNGGFDDALEGWTESGNVELSPIGGIKAPAVSVRLGSASQVLPATPGTSYTLTAFCRASRGPGDAGIAIEYLDGGGATLGEDSATTGPSPQLKTLSATGTAPAGTASIRVRLFASQIRVLIADDVALTAN